MQRPQEGGRYRALKETEVTGLISYRGPYSGEFSGRLRVGEIVLVDDEIPEGATACYVTPEDEARFEAEFVPERERESSKYGGFFVFLEVAALASDFELVP